MSIDPPSDDADVNTQEEEPGALMTVEDEVVPVEGQLEPRSPFTGNNSHPCAPAFN